jgi:tetratricopeptide (TPR) repeat protein
LHLARRDTEVALHDFDEAVRIAPRAEDHIERGRLLHRLTRYQDALKAYDDAQRAAAVRGGPPLAGRALLKLDRFEPAARAFDQYLEAGGRPSPGVYVARGLIRARQGHYSDAVENYTQALALERDASTDAYRGWVYVARKAFGPALDDFEAALRLEPESGDAYNGRGYVRVHLGRLTEAIEDARRALQHGPRTPHAVERRPHLRRGGWPPDAGSGRAAGRGWNARRVPARAAVAYFREALEETAADRRGRSSGREHSEGRRTAPIRGSPGFARLAADYALASK